MSSKKSEKVEKPYEEMFSTGKDSVETFVKVGTEAAAKGYEQAVTMSRDHFAKANTYFFKGYEDMQGFGKENLDAVIEAGTIFAKGAENIGKQMMSLTQGSVETSVNTAKALMGCKTLREVMDLQADYARSSFDALVAEGTKLSELSIKVANDAIAPIQARVTVAVEKLSKPIAA
jgi:phasin family protein